MIFIVWLLFVVWVFVWLGFFGGVVGFFNFVVFVNVISQLIHSSMRLR